MGFTKDELKRILPAMIIKLRELINNPGELEQAGTDEEKICRIIENKQVRWSLCVLALSVLLCDWLFFVRVVLQVLFSRRRCAA